ncbi:hypothetical protein B296_00049223 [Ensete ventricosum]|uniref:Uncharacterized protein n=1 Tax=Ensete ventricosum TaxID=4639 RepID=A0A426X4W5_ENSVE|nr:hypothetical protein B296_00049223 [Ensete ventricosum]
MLAVEPLRGSSGEDRDGAMGSFSVADDDFAYEALLEDISFGDLFMGIDDEDVLPDLELDPAEIFAEFSVGEEHSGSTTAGETAKGTLGVDGASQDAVVAAVKEHNGGRGDEVMSAMTREASMVTPSRARPSSPDGNKGRTPSAAAAAKGSQGKRKAKVRGLDAGAAPEIRAGGGAAGDRQSSALEDFGAHGDRLPHSAQHRQPPTGTASPTPSASFFFLLPCAARNNCSFLSRSLKSSVDINGELCLCLLRTFTP